MQHGLKLHWMKLLGRLLNVRQLKCKYNGLRQCELGYYPPVEEKMVMTLIVRCVTHFLYMQQTVMTGLMAGRSLSP